MSLPVIGVTTFVSEDQLRLPESYSIAIANEGGVPIILPKVENDALIKAQIQSLDALVLSGGDDVDPEFFGEAPHQKMGAIEPGRDAYEMKLIDFALDANIPILGICRGAQVLTIHQGGTIYQDLYSQVGEGTYKHNQEVPKNYLTHKVSIKENTKLHSILGQTKVKTNSFHHQAVKTIPDHFEITAKTSDGIIEAVESKSYNFLIGVQWHPEGTYLVDEYSQKIFAALVKAAAKN
ncbi:gamma-glutamyl-gamma-aminobutyrate hydrolase family protein [Jeotgalicoccus huakuii]|uniref:gamma-glutamyl-gamma-aminobutyrate hydrolase family protein n=1 Tax=Jeotgalicoccus TaxID=227979 RepID=UPI0004135A29|nr:MULTISPECIES: gamma-glutamyl-gamma-aminobutyrate hydrolase family protein [Jeotgalicoccus]MCK1976452.1 gamma-glutamyl-gamma-aminobutyrate hydrolase family protein [Jeotgalicoccus huakuii]QQD84374.1 gamma-glutamyl-gamma-aminobutyrate hydrolase family protein [Jeotgalicoccus sp. ATCC 8456]